MALSVPRHIAEAGIVDVPIDYEWSESIEEEVLLDQPALTERLSKMSYRAALAFGLGSVEWVVWRVSAHLPDRTPLLAVEAGWAGVIDFRYLKSLDVPNYADELPDNVGGPLTQAFWLLNEAFALAIRGKPFWQFSGSASELALRVLSREDLFKEWRRAVIKRLTECYPMPEDEVGPPVPRKLLEPGETCEPNRMSEYCADFLAGLDWAENPYLRSPEEMRAMGFLGTPYSA